MMEPRRDRNAPGTGTDTVGAFNTVESKKPRLHILADHEHPFWTMVNTNSGAS